MAETAATIKPTEEQASAAAFTNAFDEPTTVNSSPQAAPTPVTKESEATPEAPAETPPPPEYVQITKADFERMMTSVNDTDAIKKQLREVNGRMGNVQQIIKTLQDATPAGEIVEATLEDFAEVAEDFPELAARMVASINKTLKKRNVKGTGETPPATPTVNREEWKAERAEMRKQMEMEALDDLHPEWKTIVSWDNPDNSDNDFRKWLATQPEDYQRRIHNTQSALVTAQAIDKFLAAKEKAAAEPTAPPVTPAPSRAAARNDRIRDTVLPRGAGGTGPTGPTTKSPEEAMQEAFASD